MLAKMKKSEIIAGEREYSQLSRRLEKMYQFQSEVMPRLKKEYGIVPTSSDVEILLAMFDMYQPLLKKIAHDLCRSIPHIMDADDLLQNVALTIINRTYYADKYFFVNRCKAMMTDSIKTEINRYRKYKVESISSPSYQYLNDYECISDIYTQNDFVDMDFIVSFAKDILEGIEKKAFYLIYAKDFTKKKAESILGQRLDRVVTRIKAKFESYFDEYYRQMYKDFEFVPEKTIFSFMDEILNKAENEEYNPYSFEYTDEDLNRTNYILDSTTARDYSFEGISDKHNKQNTVYKDVDITMSIPDSSKLDKYLDIVYNQKG